MATQLPRYEIDKNNWVKLNNLFKSLTNTIEYIEIVLNGNNPPTVKQNTRFLYYEANNRTLSSAEVTGDNEYSAGATVESLESHGIFEDSADRTFAWSAGDFPVQSDGTWFLYCDGSLDTDSTTIGKGNYGASKTLTPVWNQKKGGWYDAATDEKILASFTSTSGTVAALSVYNTITINDGNVGIGVEPADQTILDLSGGVLRTRPSTNISPVSGKGLEISYQETGDVGRILAYDRDSSTWEDLIIGGPQALKIGSDGKFGINELAPDCDPGGLTLNHGANDGKSFTIKNSDVSHPLTGFAEADTYCYINKRSNTLGGVSIYGLMESDASEFRALDLNGLSGSTTVDTATTTGSRGVVNVQAVKSDGGTSVTNLGNTENSFVIRNNTNARYIFKGDGTAYADVAWSTFSDKRLKKNIETILYGLTEIMKMRPVKFTKIVEFSEEQEELDENDKPKIKIIKSDKTEEYEQIGFIAQDIQKIIPEIVTGEETENSYLGIDYGKMAPVLVKSIQEQQAQIEALTARVDELEKQNKPNVNNIKKI